MPALTALLLALQPAAEAKLIEYCGPSAPTIQEAHVAWECSGLDYKDVDALEAHVAADGRFRLTRSSTDRYYETPPGKDYSVWMFQDANKAVWMRQTLVQGQWKGVAMTVFCSGPRADCDAYAARLADTGVPFMFERPLGLPVEEGESPIPPALSSSFDDAYTADLCGKVAAAGRAAYQDRQAGKRLKDSLSRLVEPLPRGLLNSFTFQAVLDAHARQGGPRSEQEAHERANTRCVQGMQG